MQLDTNRLQDAFNRLDAARQRIRAGHVDDGLALDAYRSALLDTLTVISSAIAELREDVDKLMAGDGKET